MALGTLAIVGWLALPVLASAQENRGGAAGAAASGGGRAGGSGGGASSGGSSGGGGSTSSGGGSSASGGSSGGSSGGGGFSGAGGNGGRVDVGGRHAATGGSGVAVSRGAERGSNANGGSRDGGGAGTTGTRVTTDSGSGGASGRATGRSDGTREPRSADGTGNAPAHPRARDGNEPVVGTAVPRGSVPSSGGGRGVVVSGTPFYPWWIGGAGYYGGYYGGYYDPWFGGYPDPGYYDPGQGYGGSYADEGSLKLKIKPKDAEVYVDGYFVGVVDQFDGAFQRLHIETGSHRIEVRAPGYETLTFDVRITPDHSTTYQGELKRIQ